MILKIIRVLSVRLLQSEQSFLFLLFLISSIFFCKRCRQILSFFTFRNNRHSELAAFVLFTFDSNCSVHRFHGFLYNRKAQSAASLFRIVVSSFLRKRFKKAFLEFAAHADAVVLHGERKAYSASFKERLTNSKCDGSAFRSRFMSRKM